MTYRALAIYGTRPEAIKMAPLVAELRAQGVVVSVAVTGQHREMLSQVNRIFDIVPDRDLDLMREGQSLEDLTSRTLQAISGAIEQVGPDVVVVQGDTTTAFCGALGAFYKKVPVVHLEAGLRTHDTSSPFPEELNRQLISRIATLHLAPTQESRRNLEGEGVRPETVVVTGNTVIDALLWATRLPADYDDQRVRDLVEQRRPYVLVTTHRRESWGTRMDSAMRAVRDVACRNPGMSWVLPMHPNPVVRDVVTRHLDDVDSVLLTEPMGYQEFAHVLNNSHFVLTDSGGIQEEAPSLGKPVLVLRSTTERPEAVRAGTVRLIGTTFEDVRSSLDHLILGGSDFDAMARAINPYGDGRAAKRCAAAIGALMGVGERVPDFRAELAVTDR